MSDLLTRTMAWMDERWDDDTALLWAVRRDRHLVRETSLYVLGSLMLGESERARRALDAVLVHQFDAPGQHWDGTFRRAPEEDDPPDDAVMWIHFDPNWRQFIGTTFALICDRYGDLVDEPRLRASIERCVTSEPEGRVSPAYANIALMKAWLDDWSGRASFASSVVAHYFGDNGFLEFNSPTYYGIDLNALALWRTSDELCADGARLEAALWRDIGDFYHAGMRNICGPFDRTYGMDMTRYTTPLGLWFWALVGEARAPFPDVSKRFSHPHDICFGPFVAAFEPVVPEEVRPHLERFQGEHTVVRTLAGDRRITAWLSDDVMLGGWSGPTSGIGWFQHAHATAHWLREDDTVGWLRVPADCPIAATATPGRLEIEPLSETPVRFETSIADNVGPFEITTSKGRTIVALR